MFDSMSPDIQPLKIGGTNPYVSTFLSLTDILCEAPCIRIQFRAFESLRTPTSVACATHLLRNMTLVDFLRT